MCCYVFLGMTYRALEPVICIIVLLLVVVGDASYITAGIAGCITSIIKNMRCDILLISTDFTLIPVIYFIVLLLVAVSYRSCIATSITGCITGIVENVNCLTFLLSAINTLEPVIYIIVFVSITKTMFITFKGDKYTIIFFRICLGSRAFVAIYCSSIGDCIFIIINSCCL